MAAEPPRSGCCHVDGGAAHGRAAGPAKRGLAAVLSDPGTVGNKNVRHPTTTKKMMLLFFLKQWPKSGKTVMGCESHER